jgi:acyl carrier protein
MNDASLRAAVFAALRAIAPEVSPGEIAPDQPLREQVDLDSMDFLNFLIRLSKATGVDVPEADYAKLRTLDDLVAYLGARRR